ncbi:malic enzyme-like NAD(P)-binding protein [Streptosporangium roseum]|uniref:malic enzyme-like NAD(P)-binding protein n=1 Tax=Streptosporangium roseum TaxID=2001 RepID=UPI003333C6E9
MSVEAMPADLIRWTDGRALIATGIPIEPITYNGVTYAIAQADNALLYPGLGLGVAVARSGALQRAGEPAQRAAPTARGVEGFGSTEWDGLVPRLHP